MWNRTTIGTLFPNLYVVLVGPPGAGKSAVVSYSEGLLRKVGEDVHVAPSSVTSASLVDTIQQSTCRFVRPYFLQYNSLQVVASELQNFIPAYEATFMGMLTKLYDCELYEERRRTGKTTHVKIENTQLSILAGTTPSYLNSLLPEGAWDQGFTSRTIFVFSEASGVTPNLFNNDEADAQLARELDEDLLFDLKALYWHIGQIEWTKEAQNAMQGWMVAGYQPEPEHGRLLHYKTRRTQHMLKLSLVAAVSRGDEMKVRIEDFETAKGWLFEAESYMPDIFRAMTTTPESRSMEDARFYLKQLAKKLNGGSVPEHYLVDFLKHRTAPQNISKMIEVMVKAKMLRHVYDSQGNSLYIP